MLGAKLLNSSEKDKCLEAFELFREKLCQPFIQTIEWWKLYVNFTIVSYQVIVLFYHCTLLMKKLCNIDNTGCAPVMVEQGLFLYHHLSFNM